MHNPKSDIEVCTVNQQNISNCRNANASNVLLPDRIAIHTYNSDGENGSTYAYINNFSEDSQGNYTNIIEQCMVSPDDGTFSECKTFKGDFNEIRFLKNDAYILHNDSISHCVMSADGTMTNCRDSGAKLIYNSYDMALINIAGKEYAYITNGSTAAPVPITLCTIDDESGQMENCTNSGAKFPEELGKMPSFIATQSFSAGQFAYITDSTGDVYQCGISDDGTLEASCDTGIPITGIPVIEAMGLNFS